MLVSLLCRPLSGSSEFSDSKLFVGFYMSEVHLEANLNDTNFDVLAERKKHAYADFDADADTVFVHFVGVRDRGAGGGGSCTP